MLSEAMDDAMSEEGMQMSEDDLRRMEEERKARLYSLCTVIKGKRSEAIEARKSSGIETDWQEDEEFYEEIDNATEIGASKPTTTSGTVTRGRPQTQSAHSSIFLGITRPYVDAASARVSDMLLPTDDRNWALKETPQPELVKALNDKRPIPQPPGQPPFPGQTPVPTIADAAAQVLEQAKDQALKAQTQIDDWLVECQYHAEVRKVIEDTAKLGVGVIKGPVPVKRQRTAVLQGPAGVEVVRKEYNTPASRQISPWNLYPDGACGENIHNGSYLFEFDEISAKQLSALKGTDGYLDDEIDAAIEEGPISAFDGTRTKRRSQDRTDPKAVFGIWYFHGTLSKKDIEAAGCECEEGEQFPIILTMVNDRVIKIALSPLDSGEFPYDVMVWQRKAGHWAGIGVARQMRTCQRGLNAAARMLMDNAGQSAKPYKVIKRGAVSPGPDRWTFYAGPDAVDVSKFITFFVTPSLQAEFMNIVNFFLKMAEDVTGMPMLIQGQLGKAPDTVGGMQMLQNNASSVLRRIARTFDDRLTEPHIGRYYEWLLINGDDELKGDFCIQARGSSALIERDQQNQAVMMLVQMSLNPAFGLDPEKAMREAIKAQRLDVKSFEPDQAKKDAAKQQPQMPPPQIAVAQIRAQSAEKIAAMENQTDQLAIKMDTDRDTVFAQVEGQKAVDNANAKREELQIKYQIAVLGYANQRNITLDQAKVDLAKMAMEIRSTKELAAMKVPADMLPTPPIEPPGRAPQGESFQR